MQPSRPLVFRSLLVLAVLALAGCGAGTSSGQTTSAQATATAQPTAAKAKPTSAPTITAAFCQNILSLAEANQIMQPASPYTDISAVPTSDGGGCNYDPAQGSYTEHLGLAFSTYTGTVPIPQQTIEAYAAQLTGQNDGTVVTFTQVTGVGDQAAYLVASYSGQQASIYIGDLFVLYGRVLSVCGSLFPTQPGSAQESALEQCASTVIGRL